MRIGIATRDWSNLGVEEGKPRSLGGSGYYRCGLAAKVLAEMGHDVVLGTLLAPFHGAGLGVGTWDGEAHWDFDVVVLQRWMFVDLPDQVYRARAIGQVVINDVDDWWEGMDPSNLAWSTSHPRASRVENRDHYRRVLAASSFITCSTPFLEERYRRLAPTVLVRNCLDLSRWTPQEVRDGPPTLGWVGAIPWRSSGDLAVLWGFLRPFVERHDLRVVHAGAIAPGAFAEAVGLEPDPPFAPRVTETPMVPIEEHEGQFAGIDVALIPLADVPFNEAKSGLKGLQAAAAGVPYVASALPEYEYMGTRWGMGRTAKRTKDWLRELEWLMDPEQRRKDSEGAWVGTRAFGLHRLRMSWRTILEAAA